MNDARSPKWILVGIDGSDAAINAGKWAISEATGLNLPIRLVYAVSPRHPDAPTSDVNLEIQYGESALRAAAAAVEATGQPVKVETDLIFGLPGSRLIGESSEAAMVCVGSLGIGRFASNVLGSTAEEVAQHAHCPAAVIRTNRASPAPPDSGWIAVILNESDDNDLVLEHGFREAKLRAAPILAMGEWRWGFGEIPYRKLNQRLRRWVAQYPDVHIQPAAARHGAAAFLKDTQELVQLAVVGRANLTNVARLIGPIRPYWGHAGHSVLLVRN